MCRVPVGRLACRYVSFFEELAMVRVACPNSRSTAQVESNSSPGLVSLVSLRPDVFHGDMEGMVKKMKSMNRSMC